jgi:hypothetical protein
MTRPESSPEQDNIRQHFMQSWHVLSKQPELERLTFDSFDQTDLAPEQGSKAYEFDIPLPEDGSTDFIEGKESAHAAMAFWSEHGGHKSWFFSKLPSVPMFTLGYEPFIKGDEVDNSLSRPDNRSIVFLHVMPDGSILSTARLDSSDDDDDFFGSHILFTDPTELSEIEQQSLGVVLTQIQSVNVTRPASEPYFGQLSLWPGGQDSWVYEKDLEAEL